MIKILYIGSFLSNKYGTKDLIEKISDNLKKERIIVRLVSNKNSRILRIIDIIITILFASEKIIVFNVFSGKSFLITLLGSFVAKLRRKKIFLSLHGGALPEFYKKREKIVLITLKMASVIMSPSLYLKHFFESKGFIVNYLPNSIKLNNFPYKRNSYKRYSILWVRAFTDIYNPEIAIKALKIVQNKYPYTTLTMIGPDKGNLKKMINLIMELDLKDTVKIIGPVINEKLHTYYHKHEVYINTTSYESFGMAVFEAAACGIPIISSAVGEIPYIWTDKYNILLTTSIDPYQFAERIVELFEKPELAIRLSINARKKAEEFDWNKTRPALINLLTNN